MTTSALLITKKTFDAANIILPFAQRFVDMFKPDEEICIEWTSPQFERRSYLWGLFVAERGERRSFVVRGKPGFCKAVLQELQTNGTVRLLSSGS